MKSKQQTKKMDIYLLTFVFSLSFLNIRCSELMGGHYNNKTNKKENNTYIEEIPDPSALIQPGYNLPGHIFNNGKPFYVEKDPLTGLIDFNNKTSAGKDYSVNYEYLDDEPNDDIFDKSNIDRKDGGYASHRPNDVNQLSPNFHDFLNLPVKYNPEKYVYPLISSSYANTKIQGNVNKYNHKQYTVTTHKATVSPNYYTLKSAAHYQPTHVVTTTTTTTTTTPATPTPDPTENLLNSPMNYPTMESDYEYDYQTISSSTEPAKDLYYTNKSPVPKLTTKKPYSIFDELFGDYEDMPTPPPFLTATKLEKFDKITPISMPSPTSTTQKTTLQPATKAPEIISSSKEQDMYDYDDDNSYGNAANSSAVFHKVISSNETKFEQTTSKPLKNATTTSKYTDHFQHKDDSNYISITSEHYDYYDFEDDKVAENKVKNETTEIPQIKKLTSMPLGENHPGITNRSPIIQLPQNVKDSLNHEIVETTTKLYLPKPFEKPVYNKPTILQPIPSTSNIRIAPDQDTVSFVVGNHQNVDGGHYIGTALKEDSYSSNFRPLYSHLNPSPIIFSNTISTPVKEFIQTTLKYNLSSFQQTSTPVSILQPILGSETSLSIGMPANNVKTKPGQVVDEKLDINDNIEYPKDPNSKIVFPNDDLTTITPPQLRPTQEILSLYSKPMLHQLPADLTPPSEPEIKPLRTGNQRPPWDPRPGHFYQGRPEYARPPRPHKPEILYKRVDGLPNILPQFRPNAKISNGHYMDSTGTINAGYKPRQPLLDRPSNRPIAFFEKLQPPPLPLKRIQDLRRDPDSKQDRYRYEERILNVPNTKPQSDHFNTLQAPPKITNRKTENESEIATLQMIQTKQTDKLDNIKPNVPPPFHIKYQETTEKPLYVVYPVNSAPLKLDALDADTKETVVIGTRGEQMPLPPSKINQKTPIYDQKPILNPKDRNDFPILKPHSRPNTFPIKSDFPYILERPDPTLINTISTSSIDLSHLDTTKPTSFQSNNQWTSIGADQSNNQISVTLKTLTEKPIAIAYTPTEPNISHEKYSLPNFGRPVISEIRPESSEFTVSAVMHTHPQNKVTHQNEIKYYKTQQKDSVNNHKFNFDDDFTSNPTKLDFQAPFQASVNVDSHYQGWSVVNNKKSEIDRSDTDVTTNLPQTSSEFDIENFKPQLFGGFKPIYTYPNEQEENLTTITSDEKQK